MTTRDAMLDLCHKWGLCSNNGGCPLMIDNNKEKRYICNKLDDPTTIAILQSLGYDLDDFPGVTITVSESDIASILDM